MERVEQLVSNNVRVFASKGRSGVMHVKGYLIDDCLYTGSANATHHSSHMCSEILMRMTGPVASSAIDSFIAKFERLLLAAQELDLTEIQNLRGNKTSRASASTDTVSPSAQQEVCHIPSPGSESRAWLMPLPTIAKSKPRPRRSGTA